MHVHATHAALGSTPREPYGSAAAQGLGGRGRLLLGMIAR